MKTLLLQLKKICKENIIKYQKRDISKRKPLFDKHPGNFSQ